VRVAIRIVRACGNGASGLRAVGERQRRTILLRPIVQAQAQLVGQPQKQKFE
jgi:hypothetical protein